MVSDCLVSDLVADFLIEKQINVAFGIIGSANSYLFDSIVQKGYTKIVYMHHEQAVILAAGAYYRASGKIAAAIVTAGGGASNAMTGVVSNWADSVPCFILAGQESTKYITEHDNLRMYGTQGYNVIKMVQGVTKHSNTVFDKNDILKHLEEAYTICLNGRPGPVWLDIPFDVQGSRVSKKNLTTYIQPVQTKPSTKLWDVIKLLEQAKRPVIIAGHGIRLSNSVDLFRNVVNKLKIPTTLSWLGIDLLEENHPYNFGRPGLYGQRRSNFVLQNSDLILAIGCRLSLPLTGYNLTNFAPNAKIIMVNNDVLESVKLGDRCSLQVTCDCSEFLSDLNVVDIDTSRVDWVAKCNEYKARYPTIEEHHIQDNQIYDNSYVTIDNLSKELNNDAVVVIGQGTPLASGHQALNLKAEQRAFASNGLGEMGNELPSSIGAAIACPDKQVVLLVADGSMMMNLQELQTVIGYNIPLKIIMFNNDGYLFIKHTQKMLFGGRYTGVNGPTGVTMPNYRKVVSAFGFKYFSSKDSTLREFLDSKGPCFYETFMNPEQDLSPKVKGVVTTSGILALPIEEMSPLLPLKDIEECMVSGVNNLSYKIRNENN